MNVQDFYSIVQLGVGIHAGTAILQISGELGVAPVEKKVANIKEWLREEKDRGFQLEEIEDKLNLIKIDLSVFRSNYDRLYRGSVHWTFGFGCLLTLMLVLMSFFAEVKISTFVGLLIVGLSTVPAVAIFAHLWYKSSDSLRDISMKLSAIEADVKSPDA